MTGMSGYDAIVVGGGHNGLVTAAYLGRAGLRTLVLERRAMVGGAVVTEEAWPGIRVPTLAHTVGRLRPSVAADLDLRAHGLALIEPAVRVFAPQPDGRALTLWGDVGRTAAELAAWSSADAAAWPDFDRRVRALGRLLGRLATMTPPEIGRPSVADALAGLRLGAGYRGLRRDDARALLRLLPMAVADLAAESFATEPLRAVLAWRGVALSAMGPRAAGTGGLFLADTAGTGAGAAGHAVVARGGPGALVAALAGAARAAGAEIRTESEVVAITSRGDAATGVALVTGEEIRAPVVCSGLDPKRTLLGLLDPTVLGPTLAWRSGNVRQPGRVAKVNLRLEGLPRFVGAEAEAGAGAGAGAGRDGDRRLRGRIVIAPTLDAIDRSADAAKYGELPAEPVLEATIPTLLDPSLAPAGTHVMSVIVQHVPYALRDGGWDEGSRARLADRVLAGLEAVAPGLTARIVARHVLVPPDLERDYGLSGGHPLHAEPGLDQWFAWRPLLGMARYRLPLRGLYLCGSGAHPGGGVTGGPGANAAREILADRRAGVV